MNFDVFKVVAIVGLMLISMGVLTKNRTRQDVIYIFGGTFLGIYSAHLQDYIFITLQVIFIIAAIYDLIKNRYFS